MTFTPRQTDLQDDDGPRLHQLSEGQIVGEVDLLFGDAPEEEQQGGGGGGGGIPGGGLSVGAFTGAAGVGAGAAIGARVAVGGGSIRGSLNSFFALFIQRFAVLMRKAAARIFRRNPPVRTGRLARSIKVIMKPISQGYLLSVSAVFYAPFVRRGRWWRDAENLWRRAISGAANSAAAYAARTLR